MPESLHRALVKEAKKRGMESKKDKEGLSKRGKRYVYGTMNKQKKS